MSIDAARPSRRGVLRAAAWSVPVVAVAVAAPAHAASACPPVVVTPDGIGTGQQVPSGSSAVFGGVTVTLTYTGASQNAQVVQTTASSKEIRLFDAASPTAAQDVTLSFSQPVRNLALTLVNIDAAAGGYDDRVVVSTAGYTYRAGSALTGDGTTAQPFASTSTAADGVTANDVTISWAGPLSRVDFRYLQGPSAASGAPHIGIRQATFTPTTC